MFFQTKAACLSRRPRSKALTRMRSLPSQFGEHAEANTIVHATQSSKQQCSNLSLKVKYMTVTRPSMLSHSCSVSRRRFTTRLKRLKLWTPDFLGGKLLGVRTISSISVSIYTYIFVLVQHMRFYCMPLTQYLYRRMSLKD